MLFSIIALTTAKLVTTFGTRDGSAWETVNDPVMGGVSKSDFHEGVSSGIWEGKVEIVPFLKAPGFCTLRTPGLHKEPEKLLDLSSSDGLVLRASAADGLKNFRVQISTEGAGRGMLSHVMYSAEVTLTEDMADHFVSWRDFKCSHHGRNMDWFCPRLYHGELEKVNMIGLGTHYPLDEPMAFKVELASISTRDSTEPKKKCPFGEFKRKIMSFATPFFYQSLRDVVQPLIV
jgi:hypothetical protein